MSKITEELENLLVLLNLEKQHEYEQYKEVIEEMPLDERRKQGYTWLPLTIVRNGYAVGEKAFVVVERKNNLGEPHRFRSGMPVRFYTNYTDVKRQEYTGVINFIQKNRMKIILNTKDLPEWLHHDQIGVDIQFDGRTYIEMEKAVRKVMEAKGDRLAELRDTLLGKLPPFGESPKHELQLPELNNSQNQAIQNILLSRDVEVVHGPPGTGKTTTLVAAIHQLSKTEMNILVCAPSNTAADVLAERLYQKGLSVVRIGHISRVDESIINLTLEAQLAAHPDSKHIKKVKIEAAQMRKQAGRFKRKFDRSAKEERTHLRQQARELTKWVRQLEDRLVDQIIAGSQVVVSTMVGVTNNVMANRKFKTVFIDEAAQALEPATWIPITRASRVVLAGDPFQLPPTVKSNEAARKGFNETLIEKCLKRLPRVSLLTTQYRMHGAIMEFSNQQFYDGILKADESVVQHHLPKGEYQPVVFVDTAGCGFEEKMNEKFKSRYNPEEYYILREHLYQLVEHYEVEDCPSIALISPYREQVIQMQTQVADEEKLKDYPIQINTIDGFQGQERDVIYISLVRSNSKGEIGFLSDFRRMNVAMTRARKLLVIIGDSGTVGATGFYQNLIDYVEKSGGYESAWEYMKT